MPRTVDLNDVRLLVQVVEHGSYTAAARVTGIPKSTISQRIAALERSVGTGLLRRTSRSFSLTETGTTLLPHARAIEETARKIERILLDRGRDLAGTLQVSCCNALAQFALPPLVPRFLTENPNVTIRIEATNRLVDLIGEGFDMAIRSHGGPLRNSSLLQRRVARTPWSIVVAPRWLETNPMPADPHALTSGPVLCFSTTRECPAWPLRRDNEEIAVKLSPRFMSDDMAMLRASTLAGGGIACLPDYVLGSALHTGGLVPVLPDWSPAPSDVTVLTPPKPQSSRLARAFSDFLAAELPRAMQG